MKDARVDLYIAKAGAFAQPVLVHVRELVHKACPEVVEEMKWSRPFFVFRGVILGNMSAFKAHCSFGLWGPGMSEMLGKDGLQAAEGMGSFGKLTGLKDLPPDKVMLGYMRAAVGEVASGVRTKSIEGRRTGVKPAPQALEVPAELAAGLKKSRKAAAAFAGFSQSAQREYVDWIADAKRKETKETRVAQAVAWIAEGKKRNWKYEEC